MTNLQFNFWVEMDTDWIVSSLGGNPQPPGPYRTEVKMGNAGIWGVGITRPIEDEQFLPDDEQTEIGVFSSGLLDVQSHIANGVTYVVGRFNTKTIQYFGMAIRNGSLDTTQGRPLVTAGKIHTAFTPPTDAQMLSTLQVWEGHITYQSGGRYKEEIA